MNLKKATLFTMVGISYIFLSRTLATIMPAFFTNLQVAKTNIILSLLASVMPLLFYYLFYIEYFPGQRESLDRNQLMLKNAALLAFIGSLAVTFLFLKGFLQIATNPGRIASHDYFEIIASWMSAVFTLFFYYAFSRSEKQKVSNRLINAAYIGLTGASLAVGIRSYLLFEFAIHGKLSWLWNLTRGNPLVFLPLYLYMFFAGFYFLWSFYRELV